ncbi:MAG: hypothetical protein L6V81_06865 [Clostridium sp.]|nr:MAG: hypothetical protein L6V81_06865 [Clostridium sp.]
MIIYLLLLKISKDMILDTAFDIARTSGLDKVSNREIAKKIKLFYKTNILSI